MSSKAVKDILELEEVLLSAYTFEKKLTIVYNAAIALMEYIFTKDNEELPKNALHACTIHIIDIIQISGNVMRPLLLIKNNEYTIYHHSVNVAFMASSLGKEMHYSYTELIELTYAALLHDIGKMRVSTTILEKPAKLDDNEFELIKKHTMYSHSILTLNSCIHHTILKAVLFHHEKLDGSGYPWGIQRDEIPTFAQIISVSDIFDALTTKRKFRENYTSYEALLNMKHEMAHHIDHRLVDRLIGMLHR